MSKDKELSQDEIRAARIAARREARKSEKGPALTDQLDAANVVNQNLMAKRAELEIAKAVAVIQVATKTPEGQDMVKAQAESLMKADEAKAETTQPAPGAAPWAGAPKKS